MKSAHRSIHFVRTTAVGGLLFLLPLIVFGALIGQVVPIVMTIADMLGDLLPSFLKSPRGIAVLVSAAIGILLLMCFAAGVVASWSFSKRMSGWFEKNLLMLFPRYAVIKDQMADSIGGEQTKPQLKPILVRLDDLRRIAFETERDDASQLVTVYMPGSPDPWAGYVAIVDADRVSPLEAEYRDASAICEQLGRGSMELVGGVKS